MRFFQRYIWLTGSFSARRRAAWKARKNKKPPETARRSFHFQITLKILVTIVVLGLDIFGLETATEEASVIAFKKLASGYYPSKDRDDIIVITFNDADFPLVQDWDINPFDEPGMRSYTNARNNEMSPAWPLSARERRRFIEFISEAGPKAIFIDLYMPSARSDSEEDLRAFKTSLENIVKNDKIPVLMADLPAQYRTNTDIAKENPGILPLIRNDHNSPVELVMTGWEGEKGEYPLFINTNDGKIIEAPQQEPPEFSSSQSSLLSPANALFAVHKDLKINKTPSGEIRPEYAIQGPAISVMWGRSPPLNPQKDRMTEKQINKLCPKTNFLKILLSAFVVPRDPSSSWYQITKCMFHRELSGREVINLQQNNELGKVLKGKYVIIGANIEGINDTHLSPVHGIVPGVHRHAMALDNLISFEEKGYLHEAPSIFTFLEQEFSFEPAYSLSIADIIEIFFVALAFYWAGLLQQQRLLPNNQRWLYTIDLFVAFLILQLITFFIMIFVFRWIPINWLALISIALVTFIPGLESTVTAFEKSKPVTQKRAQYAAVFVGIILIIFL